MPLFSSSSRLCCWPNSHDTERIAHVTARFFHFPFHPCTMGSRRKPILTKGWIKNEKATPKNVSPSAVAGRGVYPVDMRRLLRGCSTHRAKGVLGRACRHERLVSSAHWRTHVPVRHYRLAGTGSVRLYAGLCPAGAAAVGSAEKTAAGRRRPFAPWRVLPGGSGCLPPV